ncbi:MAG: ABC-2 family transporter protein [Candidatus Andersenbacteria bacterium]|nr:ABC-2 family transporter protein [Candidatus Andersenbacteria bacterium]
MPKGALTITKRLLALSWSQTLQYRGDLIIWLTAITATPLLSLALWYTVAQSSTTGLVPRDILTYYIIIMFVRVFTASWRGYRLIEQILNGDIVNYLIRPPAIFGEFLTTPLTTHLLQLIVPALILAAVAITQPHLFTPAIFAMDNLLLFALSLLVAFVISFAFDISLGLLAFWLEDAQELMAYRFTLTQIASGVVIPFAVMPAWLHFSFSLLPFRYIISAPAEILMGQVTGSAALRLLLTQLIWAAAMTALARVLYVRGRRRYAVPGQ